MLFRPGNGSGIERPATKALREGPRGNANAASRSSVPCPVRTRFRLLASSSLSPFPSVQIRLCIGHHNTKPHPTRPEQHTASLLAIRGRHSSRCFLQSFKLSKSRRPNELLTTDIPQTSHLAPARASSFFLSLRSRRDLPPLAPFPFPSRTESRSRIPGRKSCSASRIAPVRPSSNRTDRTTPPSCRTTSSSTSPLPLTTATGSEITVGSFRSETSASSVVPSISRLKSLGSFRKTAATSSSAVSSPCPTIAGVCSSRPTTAVASSSRFKPARASCS